MRKFFTIYFANDGAGVFALLWVILMMGFITYLFLTGQMVHY
jgi:hypothetical protein